MINLVKGILVFAAATIVLKVYALTFGPPQVKIVEEIVDRNPASEPNEKYQIVGRDEQRKAALKAFAGPADLRCSAEGRKRFVGRVGHYYHHRQNQTLRYPKTYGRPGAEYIAAQYRSSDDLLIDRLTRENYRSGHLRPDEFDGLARQMILTVVSAEKVTGSGCAT